MMAAVSAESVRIAIPPYTSAEVVAPGSPAHAAAIRLVAMRFAQVSRSQATHETSYVDATENDERYSFPIVVHQSLQSPVGALSTRSGELIATARLDLHGGMLAESMIRLRPQSASEVQLITGKVGEISTFATLPGLERAHWPDVIDAIIGVILPLATDLQLEWLWIFPRQGFMRLLWAEIPDMLPAYQFRRNLDVQDWNLDSVRLQKFRQLKLRGFREVPEIFQIRRTELEETWSRRLALLERRQEDPALLDRLLQSALRRAHEPQSASIPPHLALLNSMIAQGDDAPPLAEQHAAPTRAEAQDQASFLPFAEQDPAAYLRGVLHFGGASAAAYKRKSYALLQMGAGMRVLDVGCGVGVDLLALRTYVGDTGVVIGLDQNPRLIAEARQSVWEQPNVMIFNGDAHRMAFPDESFDRVRADRTLQHCQQPDQVLREVWRVLKPGGIVTLVEPDWKAIAIYPGASEGDDKNGVFARLLEWYEQHFEHALIGRQLRARLQRVGGAKAWSSLAVEGVAYSFTAWDAVDAVLQVTNAAHALSEEDPAWEAPVTKWLTAARQASAQGQFYAMAPLFFAYARKVDAS